MGVGELHMDLRGKPKHDYDVRIHGGVGEATIHLPRDVDRKSTRLNSSHLGISYAVFCLKKNKPPQPLTMSLQSQIFQLSHRIVRRTHGSIFFNDTATTEIYPLSLHDALPI